ncbi:MAG: hypothetical protein N2746_09905 [Deltaproteobacteria bacterium]|nr:hypothetical protein [Deltaproteobacteria bacterium]
MWNIVKLIMGRQIGFEMRERMNGTHRFENGYGPDGVFPIEFDVVWGTSNILDWINPKSERFLVNDLSGHITVGGFCENAEVKGTLELKYFTEFKIRYKFEFEKDNKLYVYVGEKVNIKPWNLPVSHTTCFGTILEKDSGRLVSRSVVFFRYSTIPSFLLSLRIKGLNIG